ncbi:MAG TPA: O-antigen ligase family protein [Pirellulales bacterium]|jgi:tetratricopeptide (TPR) repeat protein|nr:O-antigen ligase family protein [Pirellulales bacterium]
MTRGVTRAARHKSPRGDAPAQDDKSELLERAPTWLAQASTLALLIAAPWFLGGVQAWFQAVCHLVLWGCLACWTCTCLLQRRSNELLPWMVLPLLAALLIPAWQLLPVSAEVRRVASPTAEALRERLLPSTPVHVELPLKALEAGDDTSAVENHDDGRVPLTIYPAGTRRRAALLVLAIEAFLLGARFFRRQRALVLLVGIAAVNGAALSFFALVQKLSWNGLLFWTIPLNAGGAPFGSFVNRNNAAGFLNISLACAVGLTVWAFLRSRRRTIVIDDLLVGKPVERQSGWQHLLVELRDSVASLNALNLGCLVIVGCIVGSIFSSLSRGGVLSMLGAVVLTWIATRVSGHRLNLGILAVVFALALGLVAWVGLAEQVEERLNTIVHAHEARPGGRGELLAMNQSLAGEFWRSGSGLGTYRYVNQPTVVFQHNTYYEFAENQYLEAVIEAGLAGLLLLLALLVLQGYVLWQLLRLGSDRSANLPWATAGLFAVASQAIHAVGDFGLYLPANLLLFAVLCGALAGRAAMLALETRGARPRVLMLPGGAIVCPALLVLLMACGGACLLEMRAVAAVNRELVATDSADELRSMPRADVERHIEALAAALRRRWDDAPAQERLAELWTRLYRYEAVDTLAAADAPADRLWQLSDVATLRARAIQLFKEQDHDGLERLRNDPVVTECLGPAWRHLVISRQSCPLLVDPHLRLAELCFLVGSPLDDQQGLARAEFLAPRDPSVFWVTGSLDLDAGRIAEACERLRKAWIMEPVIMEERVMSVVATRLPFTQILDAVVPPIPYWMLRFAEHASAEHRARILARAAELIDKDQNMQPSMREYLQARIALLSGSTDAAIDHYRRAVELAHDMVAWRFEFSELLERAGHAAEALAEARRCWALVPTNKQYAEAVYRLERLQKREG